MSASWGRLWAVRRHAVLPLSEAQRTSSDLKVGRFDGAAVLLNDL
ncbi:hypothetical protein [Streptomyces sp. NPDC001056]